jgi:hypothetical protein
MIINLNPTWEQSIQECREALAENKALLALGTLNGKPLDAFATEQLENRVAAAEKWLAVQA